MTNKPTVELSVTGPYQLHGSATFTGDAHGCVKVPEGSITASPDCYGQKGRLSIKGAGPEYTYDLLTETRELRWMTAEGEVMADNEFVLAAGSLDAVMDEELFTHTVMQHWHLDRMQARARNRGLV